MSTRRLCKESLGKTSTTAAIKRSFTLTTNAYDHVHYSVIGAGIVGLATARQLLLSRLGKVTVYENESNIASHQTAHNSGVVHAGMYYRSGSHRAVLCHEGHRSSIKYCDEKKIPILKCGKLIIAKHENEIASLKLVYQRGIQNKVDGLKWIDTRDEIVELEPACNDSHALKAIWSPHTAVVNWNEVALSFAKDVQQMGGIIKVNQHLTNVQSVNVNGSKQKLKLFMKDDNQSSYSTLTDRIISCTGLQSDKISKMLGGSTYPKIIPIRGEYLTITSENVPKTNIYPVPPMNTSTKAPPFLGIHFTPTFKPNTVLLGPNAVPALARHGYSWSNINISDIADMITHRSFWNLSFRHSKFALSQIYQSLFDSSLTFKEARSYVPSISQDMVQTNGQRAGVRAQAVDQQGNLIDDFVFEQILDGRIFNVRNAPSPAATSSMAIARMIVDQMKCVS